MITKSIEGQYDKLFDIINKAYNFEDDQRISDINDYFTILGDVKRDVQAGVENFDPYMLILPSDEGIFAIDANTRAIDIPAEFRNGIGVQGDELAEVVYFSIDRYFDTTDLYDKDIFVQWEAPSGDKGLSVTINKTLRFLYDKVVFGWPITKEMTKKAGDIKFAVRFYERERNPSTDEYSLIYSFSTLTATVKVKPALDFNIDTPDDENILNPIDKNDTIYKMMRNSKAIGLDTPAAAPIFDVESFIPADMDEKYDVGQTFKGRAFFKKEDDEQAKGGITYLWYRINKKNTPSEIKGSGKLSYEESTDSVRKSYDTYYIKNKQGEYEVYKEVIPAPDGTTIYKRYTEYTPEEAGKYYIVATNTAGRGNSESAQSGSWLIAFAEAPKVVCSDEIKHTIIAQESGATLAPEVSATDNGTLTYKWYKDNKIISNETSEKLFISYKENNDDDEGYYKVEVTNNKNNDTSSVMSEEMRVTKPASDFPDPSDWLYYAEEQSLDATARVELKQEDILKVMLRTPLAHSDRITYQWYHLPVGSREWTLIENATQESLKANELGEYKVKLINEYNKQVKEQESYNFNVRYSK